MSVNSRKPSRLSMRAQEWLRVNASRDETNIWGTGHPIAFASAARPQEADTRCRHATATAHGTRDELTPDAHDTSNTPRERPVLCI
jgi:hypothetical protein